MAARDKRLAGGPYRIRAVTRATGVPAATLRAWERRYGFPMPARTASGYRLYTDRDIELIRTMRDDCSRGIAPAEAARSARSAAERSRPAATGSATPTDGATPAGAGGPAEGEAVRHDRAASEPLQGIDSALRAALLLLGAGAGHPGALAASDSDQARAGGLDASQRRLARELLLASMSDQPSAVEQTTRLASRLASKRARPSVRPAAAPGQDRYRLHRQRILDATAGSDAVGLEAALRNALLVGSATEVYRGVLAPVLREIGERWQRRALDIGQEHMASELILGVCKELTRLVRPGPSTPCALLACVAAESHTLPLYGLSLELAERGVRSVLLGAHTPPDAIETMVEALDPLFVGLSVSSSPAGQLLELIPRYARACGPTPWVLGGAAAARHAALVEAHGGIVAGEDWAESLLGELARPSGRHVESTASGYRDS